MGDVSFRPDMCTEGGGLPDDFDGRITDARFISTDYDGKIASKVTVASIIYDIDGTEYRDLPSIGGYGDVEFMPDDTGFGLNKLKSKATLTKTCNFVRLLNSIVQAGFPLNKMEPKDISCIIGLEGHFLRSVLDMHGIKRDPKERDKTVLLCTKIDKLPWDNTKATGKSKGKGAAKVDDGLTAKTVEIIKGVLIENAGEMPKKNMMSALFKDSDLNALEDKKKALQLASNDDFLKEQEAWEYSDGVLKVKME